MNPGEMSTQYYHIIQPISLSYETIPEGYYNSRKDKRNSPYFSCGEGIIYC